MVNGASNTFPLRRFTQYARLAGAAAVVMGALVLLGWLLDVSLLKSVLPGKVAMRPNTAICFVLAGASLLLLVLAPAQHVVSATRRRAAVVCATLTATIGLAAMSEYLFRRDWGIDRFLFRNLIAVEGSGRMAAATTLGFLLLGGALLSLAARGRMGRLCSDLFALATIMIGVIALLGYLYGIQSLYGSFAHTALAVHTALLFTLLGLGVLLARPESGLTSVITSERVGGLMARRVLPVVVLLLVALAWLILKGGLVLFVTSSITALVVWVWLIARALNSLDEKKEQALKALRESEEFSRRIFESSNDCIKVLDLEGRLLSMSRGGQRLLEIEDIAPYLNKPWVDFWKGKDREAALEAVSKARKDEVGAFRAHCETAKGTPKWWDVIITPIVDAQGNVDRLLAVSRDITQHRKTEEQLRLQSAVLESAANAVVLTDQKGAIIWVNDAFTQTTGYSKEEVLGKSPRLLKSGKQDHAFYQNMWDTILAGKVWRNTIINRCRDGTFSHEDLTITPIRNTVGEITNFVGIKQDIAERDRVSEALKASELRYRRLFESAKDGILILDADSGQIVDVNPFLIDLLGFSKEEFVGKELWQIGLFKDVAASRLAFAELQQRGYIRYEDLPLETREGLVRMVEFVSNSYLVSESRVIQCNIRDITERKRFEQTLQEKNIELGNANLAKDRFLANMSHELRTPLNAIIGFTGTLLMGLPGPLNADQEHQMSIVQTSARHLLSLINDLLDLAKVESGNVETKYEPLVCQGVMEEVVEALRPLAEGKGLEFKVKVPQLGVRIAADRRMLSQILINLSNNAIKFTEKGQVRIQLSTRRSNGQTLASIEVIDTGIGIRIEDQKKLFQEFQQIKTDHRNEGTGLGLYLSEKLATLIKGKIEFESEYGKGSTFRLLIPTA